MCLPIARAQRLKQVDSYSKNNLDRGHALSRKKTSDMILKGKREAKQQEVNVLAGVCEFCEGSERIQHVAVLFDVDLNTVYRPRSRSLSDSESTEKHSSQPSAISQHA